MALNTDGTPNFPVSPTLSPTGNQLYISPTVQVVRNSTVQMQQSFNGTIQALCCINIIGAFEVVLDVSDINQHQTLSLYNTGASGSAVIMAKNGNAIVQIDGATAIILPVGRNIGLSWNSQTGAFDLSN